MRALAPSWLPLALALAGCARTPARDASVRPGLDAHVPIATPAPSPPPASRAPASVTIRARTAPYAAHPEVLVHTSAAFTARATVDIVVFLHGWNGCIAVVAGDVDGPCTAGGPVRRSMGVVTQFDRAGVDALLVMPQLAFDRPTTVPGRLADRGAFRALIAEVLAHPDVAPLLGDGPRAIGRVVLLAHSAAYVPAADVLDHGGLAVDEVLLLDAVYRDLPPFAQWGRVHHDDLLPTSATPRRLAIVYTDREGTGPNSRALISAIGASLAPRDRDAVTWADGSLAEPPREAFAHALFVQRTAVAHEDVPRTFIVPLLASARLGEDRRIVRAAN